MILKDCFPMTAAFGTRDIPQTFSHDCTMPFWGSCAFSRSMSKGLGFNAMFQSF